MTLMAVALLALLWAAPAVNTMYASIGGASVAVRGVVAAYTPIDTSE